jgi:nitroimidazol reductase NimA-like FMN-containing flavoprotein (pyridoxamine 5'-phosphate oxidase superfamily)
MPDTTPGTPESYKVTPRNRIRRLPKRAHYDRETVHAILDAGLICHVAYVIDGQPFVIPTAYWRDGERVYLHGSAASRTMRGGAKGLEISLAVTHLDGIVLARSGFHHSLNYRSVILYGTATAVTDRAEKEAALKAFMDRIAPGRWAECRAVTAQELKGTTVLSLPLEDVAAKVRTGPPVDDEPDYALPLWAGVVPVATVAGTPEPDPRLPEGVPVPGYASGFRL